MKLKKSFTLIELLIVIVITGILATITFEILNKVYKNYIYTKEMNKLDDKVDGALDEISALLRNRVKNSVIATKYPSHLDDTNPDDVDFKSIAELKNGDNDYIVLEWLGKDYEARYGMWDSNKKHIQTGWSAFADLKTASRTSANNEKKEYNITTMNSNFDIVKSIDKNIIAGLGEDIDDPFENNITTLIFAGQDLGGDLNPDVNQSFGWYLDEDKNRTANSVFAIQKYHQYSVGNSPITDLNITTITDYNNSTLYENYFLVRTAYSLVPIENQVVESNGSIETDYNLTFYYNYQPWRKDWWNKLHESGKEANHTLLINHVTQFRFKKDETSSMIRIYICVKSGNELTKKLEICKEKVIF